jgi:hypothetical protein
LWPLYPLREWISEGVNSAYAYPLWPLYPLREWISEGVNSAYAPSRVHHRFNGHPTTYPRQRRTSDARKKATKECTAVH